MERGARLAENFSEVLREAAHEALGLLPSASADPAVHEALCGVLARARDTARALRLRAVAEAAEVALTSVRADVTRGAPAVEGLLEACRGLDGTAPLLRPVVVVCAAGGLAVHRRPDGLSVQLEVVETPAELLRRARTDAPAALILTMAALEAVAPQAPPGAPLFACAAEDDVAGRARAAALGAHAVFGLPLDLRAALPVIRARQCIEGEALRALLVHPSRERAAQLARPLRARDVEVVTTSDVDTLLATVASVAPDLLILGDPVAEPAAAPNVVAEDELFGGAAAPAPARAWPGADALAQLLGGHPRYADIPRVRVDNTTDGRDACLPEDADARRNEVRRRLQEARRACVSRPVDVATGALGPVMLLSAADREIAAARRSRVPLAAVRLDLDEVAALRVRNGPSGVRAALARLAQALRSGLRETDLVGRVGPFALLALLPGCTADDARARVTDITGPLERAIGRIRMGVADTFSGFEDVLSRAERDRVSGPERG